MEYLGKENKLINPEVERETLKPLCMARCPYYVVTKTICPAKVTCEWGIKLQSLRAAGNTSSLSELFKEVLGEI